MKSFLFILLATSLFFNAYQYSKNEVEKPVIKLQEVKLKSAAIKRAPALPPIPKRPIPKSEVIEELEHDNISEDEEYAAIESNRAEQIFANMELSYEAVESEWGERLGDLLLSLNSDFVGYKDIRIKFYDEQNLFWDRLRKEQEVEDNSIPVYAEAKDLLDLHKITAKYQDLLKEYFGDSTYNEYKNFRRQFNRELTELAEDGDNIYAIDL